MRLPEYDYSLPGEYFLTFCISEREHLLGEIIDDDMFLSEEGKIAEKWIYDLKQKFSDMVLDHFVIMPNHIHLIVEIRETEHKIHESIIVRTEDNYQEWRNARSKMLISTIINYFKTNSTKEINMLRCERGNKRWQGNFYDHIIRSEKDYWRIVEYIKNNPKLWGKDRFNEDASV